MLGMTYMIKETNASINVDLLIKLVIQIKADLNVGFVCLSVDLCCTMFHVE